MKLRMTKMSCWRPGNGTPPFERTTFLQARVVTPGQAGQVGSMSTSKTSNSCEPWSRGILILLVEPSRKPQLYGHCLNSSKACRNCCTLGCGHRDTTPAGQIPLPSRLRHKGAALPTPMRTTRSWWKNCRGYIVTLFQGSPALRS